MKLKKRKATPMDWGKTIVVTALYLCFLGWVDAWWGLIVVPFIIDAYITRWIPWTWWKELKNPTARLIMSWIDAIVFALVAVYFFNIYFFQNYNIPSSSLEKSLLVGDYLVVNKMAYGPRVPQTPLHLPLVQHTLPKYFGLGGCKSYIEWPQWKYKRVSPKPVGLNDIVVFNYPAGDTIVTEMPYQTEYYSLCYGIGTQIWEQDHGTLPQVESLSPMQQRKFYGKIYNLGKQYVAMDQRDFGRIDTRPVDRRENYVKRCVGLPGQTLQIKNRVMYLDGKVNPDAENVQYNYNVSLVGESIPATLVEQAGISQDDLRDFYQSGILPLTKAAKATLEKRKDVVASISIIKNRDTRRTPIRDGPVTTTDPSGYPRRGPRCTSHWRTCPSTSAPSEPMRATTCRLHPTARYSSTARRPRNTPSRWTITGCRETTVTTRQTAVTGASYPKTTWWASPCWCGSAPIRTTP